ncbi:hypothetical protein H4Q32_002087 [Labeo rohita]|uniref:Uncharacterized protein n=1 Tax=Labeo rohita TaxID=84645 RepID=A0ABQ8MMH1_LABRO|nr:hypothetical protein H4Q32_002087 [Labeo rohita]
MAKTGGKLWSTRSMVEHALLKKLEDFPRLSNRDSHKLRELGDILLELECAKSEGYLPGLAYLDTARGLKPIVQKLPYSIQERWITEGFRYKEEYNAPFPQQKALTTVPNTQKAPPSKKVQKSTTNKSIDDRKTFLKEKSPPASTQTVADSDKEDGEIPNEDTPLSVTSNCTEICGKADTYSPHSFSKISLVRVYPEGKREEAVTMYAVLDEQSNRSLAKTEFFNIFGINSNSSPYTLKTCSGETEISGRRATNFVIEPKNGKLQIQLPTLIECDMIPDDRKESPSPEVVQHHPHLQDPHTSSCLKDTSFSMNTDSLSCSVFQRSWDDDKPTLSVDDRQFLDIMKQSVYRDDGNSLVAPQPFQSPRCRLPGQQHGKSAVAIYCMRKAALEATPAEAMDILTRTREMLAEYNLLLHKVAFNSKPVMNAFPVEDCAKIVKDLDLSSDSLPKRPTQEEAFFSFIMGKSKLAPGPALCAAVLAVELYDLLRDETDIAWNTVKCYTDSKIVLGYIHNTTRRFYVYMANRVSRIRKSTHPDQWFYISTEKNPADHASQLAPANLLQHTSRLLGPPFLSQVQAEEILDKQDFALINPETDDEIRPDVVSLLTKTSQKQLLSLHAFF